MYYVSDAREGADYAYIPLCPMKHESGQFQLHLVATSSYSVASVVLQHLCHALAIVENQPTRQCNLECSDYFQSTTGVIEKPLFRKSSKHGRR